MKYLNKEKDFLIEQLKRQGICNERVIDAIRNVRRELFVDVSDFDNAYINHPISIGYGQTISQPFTVAFMTELLNPLPGEKILEIGTGSGYQTAILCEMGAKVFSVERIAELFERTKKLFENFDYDVSFNFADGTRGWVEEMPFDGIIVTAGAEAVPKILIEQLKIGGRMVVPVGERGCQDMCLITKTNAGKFDLKKCGEFVFVPLIGGGFD